MEKSQGSGLPTIYFKGSVDALQSCDVKSRHLAVKEKCVIAGHEKWLLSGISSANYIMSHAYVDATKGVTTKTRDQDTKFAS